MEAPERVDGLVGYTVGGGARARRKVPARPVEDGDHVVVGGDRAAVDELVDGRAEGVLEFAVVGAQTSSYIESTTVGWPVAGSVI